MFSYQYDELVVCNKYIATKLKIMYFINYVIVVHQYMTSSPVCLEHAGLGAVGSLVGLTDLLHKTVTLSTSVMLQQKENM